MHIGRRMVTELVNELLGEAVIYEGANGTAQRGRKPKMLYLRTHDRLVVGVDVHYNRTYLMLGDLDGNQLALETFPTLLGAPELVEELAGRISRLLQTHDGAGSCEGIGVALPGMVDTETRTVVNSPQLGWFDVPIRDPLAAATGLPVYVDKAAIACAQAQLWLGRRGAEALDNFVYITVAGGGTRVVNSVTSRSTRKGRRACAEAAAAGKRTHRTRPRCRATSSKTSIPIIPEQITG